MAGAVGDIGDLACVGQTISTGLYSSSMLHKVWTTSRFGFSFQPPTLYTSPSLPADSTLRMALQWSLTYITSHESAGRHRKSAVLYQLGHFVCTGGSAFPRNGKDRNYSSNWCLRPVDHRYGGKRALGFTG